MGGSYQAEIVDADGGSATPPESDEISLGLSRFQLAEAEWLTGNRQIVWHPVDDLKEMPYRRAAFVELTGGVQEARTVTQGGGHLEPIAESEPNGGEPAIVLRCGRQIRHDGEVVARLDPGQKLFQLRC